jgi:glycosyltransferase involved in cell wall biosynthesis
MAESTNPPFWSVMLPVFRPEADYLKRALGSVLEQDPGSADMQISVIDDASPDVDSEQIVKSAAGHRVQFLRNETNLGLAGCWNRCVQLARGQWVHILHQDDYLLPGFYKRMQKAASDHPNADLIAARSFEVDGAGIIVAITPRIPTLENGGTSVSEFYYTNPLRCPGVAVKREFYELRGGFRRDLTFTLDWEMWTRVISNGSGVVLPEILTAYRYSGKNEAARLCSSGEAFEDRSRLNKILAERYPDFDSRRAHRETCRSAIAHADGFRDAGDLKGATANLAFWNRNATVKQKCWRALDSFVRRVIG